jgi:hypothetical protein
VVSRRTLRLVLGAGALLAGTLLVFVVWLRWNPLAQTAGPLDTLLPEGARAVARFDPGEVTLAPLSNRIWKLPSVVDLRVTSGLEEQVLRPVREMSGRVGLATFGLAPTAPQALLGEDVVVALYGEDVLVVSRLYAGGRVIDLAQSLGRERLEEAGLRMSGETAILDSEGAPSLYMTRFRDTLAISTRQDLAEAVPVIGEQGDEFPPGPGPLADLGDPGRRILVRGDPALLASWATQGSGEEVGGDATRGALHPALDFMGDLTSPDGARSATVIIDLSSPDRLRIETEIVYGEAWPDVLEALPTLASDTGTRMRRVAGLFAVPGETIVTGGLSVRAIDAVRTLADAQPPSRRALLEDLLAERGLTLEMVARGIAAHLEDGLGFVVARLNEADTLELDDPSEGGVYPVPATLVVFDLKDGASPDAALAAIIAESETLFGAKIEFSDRDLPEGIEFFRLSEHRFGGEWALLRPAVAVVGGRLIFSTHEDFLVRALLTTPASILTGATDGATIDLERGVGTGWHDGGAEPGAAPAGATLDLALAGTPLRRYVDDQRWEWADQATVHDWRGERESIRMELDRAGSVLRPEDRQTYEDARIEARLAARNRDEFPAAIKTYRARWAGLADLGGVEIQASASRSGLQLRVDIVLD